VTTEAKDMLVELIEKDLPKDIARIKAMTVVDPAKLQSEIAGTVLFHVRTLAKSVQEMRDWVYQSVMQLNDGLTDVETQVDALSDEDGTQFTVEDAEKFAKVVAGAKWMASELLKHGQTTEGTQKLKELVELATECEKIIDDGTLQDIEDDDEETEEEEGLPDPDEEAH
jgi:formyltetrahydrofolate synthetase